MRTFLVVLEAELIEATLLAQASWSSPHAERNHPPTSICCHFSWCSAPAAQRFRRIRASVTFESLRMDAFAAD
jgi:hypothetical protein